MMRAEAVAEFTGLSASYLAKLRCSGFGPPFRKIGRAVLYDPAEVQAWLDRNSRASTSDTGGAK
jgi:predicted DNA-binding transcriptional regulator AlpA